MLTFDLHSNLMIGQFGASARVGNDSVSKSDRVANTTFVTLCLNYHENRPFTRWEIDDDGKLVSICCFYNKIYPGNNAWYRYMNL